ncbi:MAG: redoxin domain-containing protein [Rhodopirellula sp.]|nr:redoxin domain-containing protein [Rhodopirellula sp.]
MNGRMGRKTALTLFAVVLLLGCREEEPGAPPQPPPPDVVQPDVDADMPVEADSKPEEPAPPPKIPAVAMTEAMAATNLVSVGDSLPEGQLVDLKGDARSLKDSYGPQLAVVLFWNGENLYALQELQDLQIDVFEPYKDRGVGVIGVYVGDSAEVAREKTESAGATYPQLLDKDGAYFAKVAKEHLPRTYLLDAEGKILWFDLEYSTGTRRNLQQAIEVALSQAGQEKTPATETPSAGAAEAK